MLMSEIYHLVFISVNVMRADCQTSITTSTGRLDPPETGDDPFTSPLVRIHGGR